MYLFSLRNYCAAVTGPVCYYQAINVFIFSIFSWTNDQQRRQSRSRCFIFFALKDQKKNAAVSAPGLERCFWRVTLALVKELPEQALWNKTIKGSGSSSRSSVCWTSFRRIPQAGVEWVRQSGFLITTVASGRPQKPRWLDIRNFAFSSTFESDCRFLNERPREYRDKLVLDRRQRGDGHGGATAEKSLLFIGLKDQKKKEAAVSVWDLLLQERDPWKVFWRPTLVQGSNVETLFEVLFDTFYSQSVSQSD